MSKVLLVEDDPFLSSLLKNRLIKEGFDVTLAKDGDEASKLLKTSNVELVLLDIILPKKSGFELMDELREDPQLEKTKVMIISNLGQPEDVTRGRQSGAIEYFIKAKTSIDELVARIKEILR